MSKIDELTLNAERRISAQVSRLCNKENEPTLIELAGLAVIANIELARIAAAMERPARVDDGALAVCDALVAEQQNYHANTSDMMPGNDYYAGRFMAVVDMARAVATKARAQ